MPIKEQLIQLIKSLKQVPSGKQGEFNRALDKLKEKNTVIADTDSGKSEACLFLSLLFCHMPPLMNPQNKRLLERFAKAIDLLHMPGIDINKRPRQKRS